jgi:hypothetical protein
MPSDFFVCFLRKGKPKLGSGGGPECGEFCTERSTMGTRKAVQPYSVLCVICGHGHAIIYEFL